MNKDNEQREIKTDNEAIAEFMDFRLDDHLSRVHGETVYSHPTKGWWPVDEPFIKDWNNLMEVVEKINGLNYTVHIYPTRARFYKTNTEFFESIHPGYPLIDIVHSGAIEFIKWYLKQKSS